MSRDPLSAWLDSKVSRHPLSTTLTPSPPSHPPQYGAEVKEHGIFAALTQHWEEEFHADMEALNVSGCGLLLCPLVGVACYALLSGCGLLLCTIEWVWLVAMPRLVHVGFASGHSDESE